MALWMQHVIGYKVWICGTSGVVEKYVRVVQDMYEDSGAMCGRSDRWIQAGSGITSAISSELLLVYSGDGKFNQ